MCKPHWREYANALPKAAVARKAEAETAEAGPELLPELAAEPVAEVEEPKPRRSRRAKSEPEPEISEVPAA